MDMFPNTPHCETVVLLQRKDKQEYFIEHRDA